MFQKDANQTTTNIQHALSSLIFNIFPEKLDCIILIVLFAFNTIYVFVDEALLNYL